MVCGSYRSYRLYACLGMILYFHNPVDYNKYEAQIASLEAFLKRKYWLHYFFCKLLKRKFL